MTKDQIIVEFLRELADVYGKYPSSDITVARAVEVLQTILPVSTSEKGT